jgi:hypothetical protein
VLGQIAVGGEFQAAHLGARCIGQREQRNVVDEGLRLDLKLIVVISWIGWVAPA